MMSAPRANGASNFSSFQKPIDTGLLRCIRLKPDFLGPNVAP